MTTDSCLSDLSLSTSSKIPLALTSPSITSSFRPPAVGPHDATSKIKNDQVLAFGRISSVHHALIGRRTCVVHATAVEGDSNERESESIVTKSRNTKAETFEDSVMRATNSNGVELCTYIHHEAFPMDAIDAQCRFSKYTSSRDTKYKNHVLRLLIMTELFQMIDMTADTLIPVIKDVFKCYKWLYETNGVIHRDISENNLMYRKKGDGTICGVLSDYDLSSKLARQDRGPSSKHRMGTKPFMARDLLEATPIPHLYRHDLESLFYVIIVLIFRGSQDETLKEDKKFESFPHLKHWFTLGPAQLLREKKAFYSTELPQVPPVFKKLRRPILKMMNMFDEGYHARLCYARMLDLSENPVKPSIFNESTLDGHVDFDKLQEILDSI